MMVVSLFRHKFLLFSYWSVFANGNLSFLQIGEFSISHNLNDSMYSHLPFTLEYTDLKVNTNMRSCGLPDKEFRVIHGHRVACRLHVSEAPSVGNSYGHQSHHCHYHFSSSSSSSCFCFPFFFQIECLRTWDILKNSLLCY